jgi:hypothetical protein
MTINPSLRYLSLAGGALVAVGTAAAYLLRVKKKTPEERERERRDFLNLHGRIIDGTVLDFTELADAEEPDAPVTQLLLYQYEISGVQNEASQDVTYLRQYVDVHSCKLGLPASIKYDPLRPQNSMVVSEQWSGLRTGRVRERIVPPSATARTLYPQPQ